MKFLYRLFVRFLVVVVVFSLLSLGYLHLYGFPDFLKEMLLSELQRAGYAAQFTSIRLDLFRGVVATDATFADAKTPDQPLAQIDELELQFSLKRLLHKQTFIRAIHIANAVIAIPTPPDENGPAKFTASDAYATFKFEDDGSIRVDRLTGVYCGIRLNVSGRIKPRSASATTTTPATVQISTKGGQFLFFTKAVRELNQIQVTLPPQLDLDFDLDLAQPLVGHVVAKLRGSQLQYRDLHLDSAGVDIEMTDGAIELHHCEASLYGGEIDIHGRYDIAMGQFDVALSSTTDPAAIVPLVIKDAGPILRDLRVQENPKILARYRLNPETGSLPELTGTVQTGGLTFQGIEFRSIKFGFEDRGPQVKFNDVDVVTPGGRLTGHGEYHLESTDFTYEFDSTIDPTKLLPVMFKYVRQIVEPAWFETPPHIVAKVRGDFVDPDALAYDAQIDAHRCSYRGVGLESASARLRLRESRLDVEDLQLERREGDVRGMLFADFNAHRVNFDLTARANPSEIAGLLGEKAVKTMAPYRFGSRTNAKARGVIDFDKPEATTWAAHVFNEGFSYWKFTADRAQATLVFTNNTMQINDFDADFYGGKLRGRAGFVFSDADPSYNFEFSVDHADVHSLLTATEDRESTVTGLLTGQATIDGRGNDLSSLSGTGQLNVTDGILWQAPVFGIFSEILGKTKATRAQASFTITNQAVSTEDMQIAAGAFTAESRGQLGFDGKLDFRVEAQFLRAWPGIGWISPLIGKLLEYKVGGTIGDPKYRPVNLPKELLPSR
ncbi:MAG TPA: AsmA-like C-terminal region-containing protein [Verrucomicrobiae bacterium]|nr:AsmA-like C-terminal region-containing protein [Verrucomicrobiae bacterium]